MATFNHGGSWEQVFPPRHNLEESLSEKPKTNMVLDQGDMKFIEGGSNAAAADAYCPTGASQGPGVAGGMEVDHLLSCSLSISHSSSCSVA